MSPTAAERRAELEREIRADVERQVRDELERKIEERLQLKNDLETILKNMDEIQVAQKAQNTINLSNATDLTAFKEWKIGVNARLKTHSEKIDKVMTKVYWILGILGAGGAAGKAAGLI